MRRKRQEIVQNPATNKRNGSLNHVENLQADTGEEDLPQNGANNSVEKAIEQSNDLRVRNGGMHCGISLVGVLKVVILVIVVPPFLNYASLQREAASLLPHGEMHAGPQGNKLFMNCSGRGSPVVMMDTPGGFSSEVWLLVQSKVAKFTKVCVYDRGGLGFSERVVRHFYDDKQSKMSPDDFKQLQPTTENMVSDMHHLLRTVTNNTNDVVLVGGGLGAVNARFYASFYESVFGLVLVNPFHEDMFTEKEWTAFWYDHFIPSLQMEQLLAFLGVTRLGILTGLFKPTLLVDGHFQSEVEIKLKYLSCNSYHLSSGIMEHFYTNESTEQLKILEKVKPFPKNITVSLLSSKNFSDYLPPSLNQFWFKNQELLAREMFPKSERTTVDSDFNTVYFNNAEIIAKAINKLVQKFRKSVKQSANI